MFFKIKNGKVIEKKFPIYEYPLSYHPCLISYSRVRQ